MCGRWLGRRGVFLCYCYKYIFGIFGFVGLQSITRIVCSREDIEPDACCPSARIYVLSLGSFIILEKKWVLCQIPELLADFVK